MKKCPNCLTELNANDIFCSCCGEKIDNSSSINQINSIKEIIDKLKRNNPFGASNKIVLEFENMEDGTKKLTRESEYIIAEILKQDHFARYETDGIFSMNFSDDFICWLNALKKYSHKNDDSDWQLYNGNFRYDFIKERDNYLSSLNNCSKKDIPANKILLQFLFALYNEQLMDNIKDIILELLKMDSDKEIQEKLQELLRGNNPLFK